MSLRVFVSCVLLAVFATAAGAARADDCDDVTLVDGAHRLEAGSAPHPSEAIVPCALIDSGVLGPECADAFYVVNHQGTVLCRVDLLAFSVEDGQAAVQRDDAPATAGSAFVAVGVSSAGVVLPAPPLFVELPGAPIGVDAGPADAHLFERPRPS